MLAHAVPLWSTDLGPRVPLARARPCASGGITIGALATISILRENITQFSPDHTKQEINHEYANR